MSAWTYCLKHEVECKRRLQFTASSRISDVVFLHQTTKFLAIVIVDL